MKFGETLIDLRKRNGLTQEELAAKLYVTRQAVSRWERGEVTPGIDMLKLIANVLDEPVAHLLDWPEHYCESCGMMLAPKNTALMSMALPTHIIANGAISRANIPTRRQWTP